VDRVDVQVFQASYCSRSRGASKPIEFRLPLRPGFRDHDLRVCHGEVRKKTHIHHHNPDEGRRSFQYRSDILGALDSAYYAVGGPEAACDRIGEYIR
jgi:hypothetical protein